eukprot:364988-Chlamydomonas_euryale.AAC.34
MHDGLSRCMMVRLLSLCTIHILPNHFQSEAQVLWDAPTVGLVAVPCSRRWLSGLSLLSTASHSHSFLMTGAIQPVVEQLDEVSSPNSAEDAAVQEVALQLAFERSRTKLGLAHEATGRAFTSWMPV